MDFPLHETMNEERAESESFPIRNALKCDRSARSGMLDPFHKISARKACRFILSWMPWHSGGISWYHSDTLLYISSYNNNNMHDTMMRKVDRCQNFRFHYIVNVSLSFRQRKKLSGDHAKWNKQPNVVDEEEELNDIRWQTELDPSELYVRPRTTNSDFLSFHRGWTSFALINGDWVWLVAPREFRIIFTQEKKISSSFFLLLHLLYIVFRLSEFSDSLVCYRATVRLRCDRKKFSSLKKTFPTFHFSLLFSYLFFFFLSTARNSPTFSHQLRFRSS